MKEIFLVYVHGMYEQGWSSNIRPFVEEDIRDAHEYSSIDEAQAHMEELKFTRYTILKKM